ncbi:hypothetical protein HID58_070193 [Brassica napus]|uniref:Uncharacterized protein n=1 Tax=Brassica napus TaxID=3708 RepID=A0ABQ7YY28_BRANA|nr:hypothetical protein HID58_070193 [Brassica napus]
MAPLSRTLS